MDNKRPINLNLTTIRFPLAAIASITHRITGVILFLGMALLLYLFQMSLVSEAGFDSAVQLSQKLSIKAANWLILVSLSYHVLAGTKHLLLDLGWGETKASAEFGGIALLVSLVACGLLAGIWIWS